MLIALLLQIIPAERTADWARAGVPAKPERTRVVEIDGDPQEAIDKAKPDDVLLLPAGIYDGLRLRSRITLRGAGPSKTILKGPLTIGLGGADWWYPNRLKVDVQGRRGLEALQVSDTSRLEPGMVVQLAAANDATVVGPRELLRRQVTRIVAKSATHVTVSPPPLFDLAEGSKLAPGGRMAEFVGVEDLSVESNSHIGIHIAGAYGCWLRNVVVRSATTTHISMSDALFCEITRCVISTGDESAGISLGTSSYCKIEDNVLAGQSPHVAMHASTGNVVAYNLCRDSDIYGVLGPSLGANTGPHSGFNLYEGNVATKYQVDSHHGSGSHDTVFRNRLHGTSTSTAKLWICVNLNRTTRDVSVVGNVLGAPGHPWLYDNGEAGYKAEQHLIYAFGLGNSGRVETTPLDPEVRRTTLRKGNFNWKDAKVPEAEVCEALPPSLYLSAKPAWWGELAWPPFGPDVAFEKHKIPAELRD